MRILIVYLLVFMNSSMVLQDENAVAYKEEFKVTLNHKLINRN